MSLLFYLSILFYKKFFLLSIFSLIIFFEYLINEFFSISSLKKRQIEDSYKLLVISDIHNDINKIKLLVEKLKSRKFDYIFFCGDGIILTNNSKKRINIYMKYIFTELEKLGPILWVPGNHDFDIYYDTINAKEVTNNSQNLHKKIKKLNDNLYIVGLGGSLPILEEKFEEHFPLFKHINFKKYQYSFNDEIFIKELNKLTDTIEKEENKGVQILYLTHIGPLYTPTSILVENKDILYMGSKKLYEKFVNEDKSFIIIHGHSHTSEGYNTLKNEKHIFNPGSLNKGHYGLIEIKKKYNKWIIDSCSIYNLNY